MKFRFYTTLLIATLSIASLSAQEHKWSLEECMQYAVDNSPLTNIQKGENRILREDYKTAIAALLPTLNASTGVGFNFGRAVGEDNTYKDANSFSNSYYAGTSLTIFSGLTKVNNIKLQRVGMLQGKLQLQIIRDEIAYNTMEAFLNVQYFQELVDLAHQQVEESRRNVVQYEAMMELGLKGFPDVAEMKANVAADTYKLTQQVNQLAIAVIKLKEQMNFPIYEELGIVHYSSNALIARTEDSAADIYSRSLEYLPQALSPEKSVEIAQLNYRITKGQLLPSISADASFNTSFFRMMDGSEYKSYSQQLKGKKGWNIGGSLSIPIFNGYNRMANVRKSKFRTAIAENRRDQSLRTLYMEIEQAVADMNGQADEYSQAVLQTESMEVAHKVNQRKFEEGLVDALQVTITANRLYQAQIEEKNARYRFYLKQRLVNYYNGEPFIYTPDIDETN